MVASRRSRSVPPSIVEVGYDYGFGEPAALKAHRIHQYVVDDHDALSRASRRQDANLLNDITARMEATDYRSTPLFRRSRARALSPPPFVLVGGSHLPSRPRHQRASSVPPSFRETQTTTSDFYPSGAHHPSYYGWRSHVYVPERVRAGSEPPIDRRTQVHHHHHHQVQRGHPRGFIPSTDLAVRHAWGALSRLERELGSGWDDPYYDVGYDVDYAPTPSVRPYRAAAPVSTVSRVAYPSPLPIRTIPRSPSLPRYSRAADVEMIYEPDHSFLRQRTADAHRGIDHHKAMMDRYLPIHLGPEPEVGMPHLERRRSAAPSVPARPYYPSAAPAAAPATPVYTPPPRRPPPPVTPISTGRRASLPEPPPYKVEKMPYCRPPVSDVRRRAREVLCKTKRDPGYYDD